MRTYKSTIYSPGVWNSNHNYTGRDMKFLFRLIVDILIDFSLMFFLGLVVFNHNYVCSYNIQQSWIMFLIIPTAHVIISSLTSISQRIRIDHEEFFVFHQLEVTSDIWLLEFILCMLRVDKPPKKLSFYRFSSPLLVIALCSSFEVFLWKTKVVNHAGNQSKSKNLKFMFQSTNCEKSFVTYKTTQTQFENQIPDFWK